MFLQSIELLPINLLQIAFFTMSGLGTVLLWRTPVYRSLSLFFLYQAFLMLMNLLEETQLTRSSHLVTPALTLLVGPLLYFSVRSLVNEIRLSPKQQCLQISPAILALPFTEFTQTIIALGTVSQIVYLAACFKLLNRYHLASVSTRSDADSLKLTWIFRALILFTVFAVTDLVRLNIQTQTSVELKAAWYFIDVLVLFCISLYLLLKAMSKPLLFTGMLPYEQSVKPNESKTKPNDRETALALFKEIEKIIVDNQLFKRPRLSITDVADETGLNIRDISWAINQGSQQNFCEYINALRVKAMTAQIVTGMPKNKKILELAFDSGFNSKSTFNTAFKKEVGMTPTQYLQKQ